MERSILLLTNSVKSSNTAKQYLYYATKFREFCKYSDFDTMADKGKQDYKGLQIQVEDYVMFLKSKVNPNSVPTFVYPIFSFCEANDIVLNTKKIKKMFPALIKKSGREAYTTDQVNNIIKICKDPKHLALIHFLASTGVRIGAIPDLTIANLQEVKNCYAVTVYADTTEEYITFLSPEARQALDNYFSFRQARGEIFSKNTPVFRAKFKLKGQKVMNVSEPSISAMVLNLTRKAGLRNPLDKKNGRYPVQQDHGFRKRFVTVLKSNVSIPIAYAERMAGHKIYSDDSGNRITLDESYLRPQLAKLFSFFEMAIPELTIDQTHRLQLENELQQKKIIENEQLRKRVSELEAKYYTLELDKKQTESETVGYELKRIESVLKNPHNDDVKPILDEKSKTMQRLESLTMEIEQIKKSLGKHDC